MKKLLLLFFLFPFSLCAQDWHGVPYGQHNIYKVSVTGVDSFWNNYVRNIYVVDSNVLPNGIRYNFYKSLRLDHNEVMDTTNGPTFLGRFVFRENNGDEIYLNKYLDTIRIKTKASHLQKWTMGYDTSGTIRYEATAIHQGVLSMLGFQDSVLDIGIQAYQGSTPVPSIYNTYIIKLSKHHGFYHLFDFYGFPNYQNAVLVSGSTSTPNPYMTSDIYPILPSSHVRLSDSMASRGYQGINTQIKFQLGNEWIIRWKGPQNSHHLYYDSIISVAQISPSSMSVTTKHDSLYWQFVGTGPPQLQQFFGSGITTDTFPVSNGGGGLIADSLERAGRSLNIFSNKPGSYFHYIIRWKFLDTFCQDKMLVRDTFSASSLLTCYTYNSFDMYEGLGLGLHYRRDFVGCQQMGIAYAKLDYLNINGCKYGTYYPLRPNNITPIGVNDHFKLYPNPTSNTFFIETDKDWSRLEIMSMQGQVLRTFDSSNGNSISLDNLPRGVYIVNLKTKAGKFIQKIVKE